MSKRPRPKDMASSDNYDDESLIDIATEEFRNLFKDFQNATGYPNDQRTRSRLACPIERLWPDKYGVGIGSCHGMGFLDHQKLNEHIEREHNPNLTRNSNKDKPPPPQIDKAAYNAWKSERKSSKTRRGSKMGPEDIKDKWWHTAEALKLGDRKTCQSDDDHLAFPGSDLQRIRVLDTWLRSHGKRLFVGPLVATEEDFLASLVANQAGPFQVTHISAAEMLNDRPQVPEVDFDGPPGDSGYYSQSLHDDHIWDDVISCLRNPDVQDDSHQEALWGVGDHVEHGETYDELSCSDDE